MGTSEFARIGTLIADVLEDPANESLSARVGKDVSELCEAFPLYAEFRAEHALH